MNMLSHGAFLASHVRGAGVSASRRILSTMTAPTIGEYGVTAACSATMDTHFDVFLLHRAQGVFKNG